MVFRINSNDGNRGAGSMFKDFIGIIPFFISLFLWGSAYAGNIEAKLPTKGGTDAFQVQDSDGKPLLHVNSAGKVGVGTINPKDIFDVTPPLYLYWVMNKNQPSMTELPAGQIECPATLADFPATSGAVCWKKLNQKWREYKTATYERSTLLIKDNQIHIGAENTTGNIVLNRGFGDVWNHGSDILFNMSGSIAAERDLYLLIDSNNEKNDRKFSISTNAETINDPNRKELLVVKENGNVGIGIDDPQETLHVGGNIRGNGVNDSLRIQTRKGYLNLGPRGGDWSQFDTNKKRFFFNREVVVHGGRLSSYAQDLTLWTDIKNNPLKRLTIQKDTGNVGIATARPEAKLHVNGTMKVNGKVAGKFDFENFVETLSDTSIDLGTQIQPLVSRHKITTVILPENSTFIWNERVSIPNGHTLYVKGKGYLNGAKGIKVTINMTKNRSFVRKNVEYREPARAIVRENSSLIIVGVNINETTFDTRPLTRHPGYAGLFSLFGDKAMIDFMQTRMTVTENPINISGNRTYARVKNGWVYVNAQPNAPRTVYYAKCYRGGNFSGEGAVISHSHTFLGDGVEYEKSPRITYLDGIGLTATAEGDVGIGISNPSKKLHVAGDTKFDGSVSGNQKGALRIQTDSGYVDVGGKNTYAAHFYTDLQQYFFNKPVRVDTGNIGSHNEDLTLRTGNTSRITVNKDTGNVGIGNSSPVAKLDVSGDLHVSGKIIADGGVQRSANKWTSIGLIELCPISLQTNTTIGCVLPDSIPTTAKEILVFIYVNTGVAVTGLKLFEIYTEEEGSKYPQYMQIHGHGGNTGVSYNSDNLWLPYTPERQVKVTTTGTNMNRNSGGQIYVTGYR